jgi:cyclic beta-1,2-glucan synthetase
MGWTLETARLQSERELTGMHLNSEHVHAAFSLLARMLWPARIRHIEDEAFSTLHRVQDSLWSHGISGDRPIVTQRLDGEEDLGPADSLLQSLSYLSRKNCAADVIFLDETKNGYTSPVNDRLRKLVEGYTASGEDHGAFSVFIVPVRNLAATEKSNLIAAARLYIDVHGRATSARFGAADQTPVRMPAFVPQPSAPLSGGAIAPVKEHENLQFKAGPGGMLPGHDGYSLLTSESSRTPAPWCNVLANPEFGTLVSESGSMSTWWGNSSENRLTPWSNDPVLDTTGEAVYVRDEETGESWSLTPQPRPDGPPYRVTHATGQTRFEHNSQGLEQQLLLSVDAEQPVKILRIRLGNKWPRDRRLTVTYAVQWLLGNSQDHHGHLLLPERDSRTGALLVRNAYLRHGGEELAFVASSLPAHGVSCDGVEFFGMRRSWAAPAALTAVGLSDRIEPSAQPCAVYQVHIDLPMDESREFHFVLGAAVDRRDATKLLEQSRQPAWADQCLETVRRQWDERLGAWQVNTPDPAADAMINRWLLYQVISSRLWGRTGFYQASGGFGFRDQLQDVLALLDANPGAVREHLLVAASRQFEQGDVLHWWHEAPLRGVRTRCSDDLLWLAYAVSEYIEVTGDLSILNEKAAFLRGEPLRQNESEHYAEYQPTEHKASVYEHCFRAIDARVAFGEHGLPLFGSGDWNDGLNRVGEKGRGESVWMAWFLVVVCRRFAPLCRQMKDGNRADHYQNIAADLLKRAQKTAWAGGWYLRGWFDDGSTLGAPGDGECEIDLNAQTWAVLADGEDPAAGQAMRAVEEKLVDSRHRLIKLLAPPFEKTNRDPGYIKSYPPGVRENGGQYTHAAVWAAWAAAELGDGASAMRWFEWLNPLKRATSDEEIQRYRLEPYVTCGDIYGVGALAGRGGWSWYTGSAAWLYRFAIRKLLGLQRMGNRLFLRPCLTNAWPAFKATLRYQDAEYDLRVHAPADIQRDQLFMLQDGEPVNADSIPLESSGRHVCEIFASDVARQNWLSDQAHSSDAF